MILWGTYLNMYVPREPVNIEQYANCQSRQLATTNREKWLRRGWSRRSFYCVSTGAFLSWCPVIVIQLKGIHGLILAPPHRQIQYVMHHQICGHKAIRSQSFGRDLTESKPHIPIPVKFSHFSHSKRIAQRVCLPPLGLSENYSWRCGIILLVHSLIRFQWVKTC